MATKVVILGNGGHARVVRTLVPSDDIVLAGENDRIPDDAELIVGIGSMYRRIELFNSFLRSRFISVAHDTAFLDSDEMGPGTVIMANAVCNPGSKIGDNVVINTGAQVDHDSLIGDHCVIGPGAIICGGVHLGKGCAIGAGAIIVQGARIDEGTFIPAGALAVRQGDLRRPVSVQWHSGTDLPPPCEEEPSGGEGMETQPFS